MTENVKLESIESLRAEHAELLRRLAVFTKQAEGQAVYAAKVKKWTAANTRHLETLQVALGETLESLYADVKDHYMLEEKVLPPAMGDQVIQGLIAEHKLLDRTFVLLRAILKKTESLEKTAYLQLVDNANNISRSAVRAGNQLVKHENKEEALFELLKEGLGITLDESPEA